MEYIMIQVTDKGGGISSEDMPRVFTRLYRADNVLIQGVGDTGVGLSIAKTLTEAQHGRIWVESEIGTGSTFSVLLPFSGEKPAEKQKRK
jgi:signal transduction histidine kinase